MDDNRIYTQKIKYKMPCYRTQNIIRQIATVPAYYDPDSAQKEIEKFIEDMTVNSIPLTKEESKILSDNLFELIGNDKGE